MCLFYSLSVSAEYKIYRLPSYSNYLTYERSTNIFQLTLTNDTDYQIVLVAFDNEEMEMLLDDFNRCLYECEYGEYCYISTRNLFGKKVKVKFIIGIESPRYIAPTLEHKGLEPPNYVLTIQDIKRMRKIFDRIRKDL